MKRVLFLCTGNFYRSRFAEAVFNHHAALLGMEWRAFSRGLAIHQAEGDLSIYTLRALAEREIDRSHTGPTRVSLLADDLSAADLVIALDENEHRPMVARGFAEWETTVRYWDVCDVPYSTPEVALPCIEGYVLTLLDELRAVPDVSGADSP